MKKSNIILLGGFLALLLFVTAIHLTLYAKYKNNDFTLYNAADDVAAQSLQKFPNVLFVSVQNVRYATVKFSDVAQVENDKPEGIQYVQKGDTLQISGRPEQEGFEHPFTVYVPANATVLALNSSLTFETGNKAVPGNPVIYLRKSNADFSGAEGTFRFGQLSVRAADSSEVVFNNNAQIDTLHLQLSHSAVSSDESKIGQLSIITDSVSRISLPAKQLLKATIQSTTN